MGGFKFLPLPLGEGRGEGCCATQDFKSAIANFKLQIDAAPKLLNLKFAMAIFQFAILRQSAHHPYPTGRVNMRVTTEQSPCRCLYPNRSRQGRSAASARQQCALS